MNGFALGSTLWVYSYAGYPLLLWIAARRKHTPEIVPAPDTSDAQWPRISIVVPAYNEAATIASTLEALLALDYPADRRQVLVLSDASTDGTDEIVESFASRGVELLRMRVRAGKTSAENFARRRITGDIVINTDASVRAAPGSIKPLVAQFADPAIGVASSRDMSVARVDAAANAGESAYVGYEMWVRELETNISGIVGASGCLYAIRRSIHDYVLPPHLSRDFAAALEARRKGFRAVSVNEAVCFVPRGAALQQEYRRKVRTMARGLATLMHFRALMNPFEYGVFAWSLISHKLCRWLLPFATIAMGISLARMAPHSEFARLMLFGSCVGAAIAAIGWRWPQSRAMPRLVSMPAYLVAGIVAGVQAWWRLLRGQGSPTWEPTRRGAVSS